MTTFYQDMDTWMLLWANAGIPTGRHVEIPVPNNTWANYWEINNLKPQRNRILDCVEDIKTKYRVR